MTFSRNSAQAADGRRDAAPQLKDADGDDDAARRDDPARA